MPIPIYATPNAPEADTGVPADGAWADTWAKINEAFNAVPTLAWVAALAILTITTLLAIPALRALTFKAGTRHGKTQLTDNERRDRRLLIAAMIPASLFWIAVIIGSGRGLIAFGREDLRWTGGWEFLVPFTLDGVAISFALLAFRAVKKKLNPDRAVKIAGLAMLASAGINFLHEIGGSKLGAGYLAILSLLGMLIFDELLGQFELGAETEVRRKNPKFGLRWITWPTNTLCAWIAWRNWPPAEVTKATIANAVLHLGRVRRDKTARHAKNIDSPVWWMRLAPWAHTAALRVALDGERTIAAGKLTAATATITDLTARLDRIEKRASDVETERASANTSVRDLRSQVDRLRQQITATEAKAAADKAEALREQREQLTAEMVKEMANKVAQARAEARLPNLGDRRDKTSGKGSPKTVLTDEVAVQKLLAHPGDEAKNIPAGNLREWSQKAIVEALGVGYGRAPRLLEAVTEAQRGDRPETDGGDAAVSQ